MNTQPHISPGRATAIAEPISGSLGAIVTGIRLSSNITEDQAAFICTALAQHKVIFFRDQEHLTDQEQECLAARLGTVESHPTIPPVAGTRYIFELDSRYGGRAAAWHTDATFTPSYSKAAILRAITLPTVGGDTAWANTARAYERLPQALKDLADQLWAVHSNGHVPRATSPKGYHSTLHETEHPVVRVHPETGERTLVLGGLVTGFVGYDVFDFEKLYALFQDRITRLDNMIRWRGRMGDVAMWDNRATQHHAINDYGDQLRVMRRCTLAGEIPVSVDGRHSRSVKQECEA